MDELILSGKKYISSKRASELTGYAKDYIGQLARSGKLPATRIGRAWYVEESKLISHEENQEPAEVLSSQKILDPVDTKEGQVRPQSPFRKHRTFSSVSHALAVAPKDFQKTWSPIRYLPDHSSLFPLAKGNQNPTPPSISSKQSTNISDSRESSSLRIRILKDNLASKPIHLAPISSSLQPTPAKTVFEPISAVKKTITGAQPIKKSFHRPLRMGFAIGIIFLASAGIVASGVLISSHVHISDNGKVYSANAIFSFEYAKEVLASSPIFQGGLHALGNFFSTIFNSFGELFSKGFQFILGITHLG